PERGCRSSMQISANTTAMPAGLCVTADRDARDHCVVVVKGTFRAEPGGAMRLAEQQCPLVYADEYYGAPEASCVRYETDFALVKPMTDVIVVGRAVAPTGTPVSTLRVRLEVGERVKEAVVFGERRWTRTPVDPVEFR